jgi:cytosolic carboxypeptidase protein 6
MAFTSKEPTSSLLTQKQIVSQNLNPHPDSTKICENIFNFVSFLFRQDMKIGRNLARSILEYYRFTNILAIPIFKDVKRKGRPKSHRPQRKFQNIYPSRPKTTRENAPISYTDLSIYYDSDTSADYTSPARYPFHSHFMLQHNRLRYFQTQTQQQDPCTMTSQKLSNLELSPKAKRKEKHPTSTVSGESTLPPKHQDTFTLATKPYLSIIDFNMLTRGGLEEAVANKSPEKVCPHHQQQQSKITRPKTADPSKMK